MQSVTGVSCRLSSVMLRYMSNHHSNIAGLIWSYFHKVRTRAESKNEARGKKLLFAVSLVSSLLLAFCSSLSSGPSLSSSVLLFLFLSRKDVHKIVTFVPALRSSLPLSSLRVRTVHVFLCVHMKICPYTSRIWYDPVSRNWRALWTCGTHDLRHAFGFVHSSRRGVLRVRPLSVVADRVVPDLICVIPIRTGVLCGVFMVLASAF